MYEKQKLEFYQKLGGINTKASEYITSANEFLDIRNYMFFNTGTLSSRPGQTDFLSLAKSNYLSNPAGLLEQDLNFVATEGATINSFLSVSEKRYFFDSGQTLSYIANSTSFLTTPFAVYGSLTPGGTISYPIDYVSYRGSVYWANAYAFGLFDGVTFLNSGSTALIMSYFFSLPEPFPYVATLALGQTTFGLTFNSGSGDFVPDPKRGSTTILESGTYSIKFAYKRFGQRTIPDPYYNLQSQTTDDGSTIPIFSIFVSTTTTIFGRWELYGFTIPPGYGISSIVPYIKRPNSAEYISGDLVAAERTYPWDPSGPVGSIFYGIQFEDFRGASLTWTQVPHFTLVPAYIEMYKNMMFMAGFSSQSSTVWHSEVGLPQNVREENFFEVRTENGDQITCLKDFQDSLIIFKYNSVHELVGSSPGSLSLKDMTLEYGCVNNTAAVTFENKLWFVDKRGICEYNGPQTFVVSDKVEDFFNTLDVSKARALHVKKFNEVWFAFGPSALVWNYQEQAWTIFENFDIQNSKGAAVLEYGSSQAVDLMYFQNGSSHWRLSQFREDLSTDFGSNISLSFKTPYLKRFGESTQEMWRRLYFDVQPTFSDFNVTMRFRQDYGTSVVLTRGQTMSDFEYRIDFGISSKSLSVEFLIQANQKVVVNGYALESRYLRSV